MSFKAVRGQDHVARIFQTVIGKGRLAHAYIFLGPQGIGKRLFAKELAKALVCSRARRAGGPQQAMLGAPKAEDASPPADACDECRTCKMVEANNHPDVSLVAREAKREKFVKIDRIRELQDAISLKPVEGGYKVFVVDEAERMNEEAANCFLKTLEEPPPRSLLILLATTLESLPATIISRCQVVRFLPLSAALVAELLQQRLNVPPDQAQCLATLGGGSLGVALRLAEEEAYARRNALLDRIARLQLEDNFEMAAELTPPKPKSDEGQEAARARLKQDLSFLLLYYRDVLMRKMGADSVFLFNRDKADALAAHADRLSGQRIHDILDAILTTGEYVDMNASISLALENMVTRIGASQSAG
ncbi:MAG: DNA polymerase III subunit delta' [Planctomycetes bacterium]|nr:DNA polymerase III subunit delta' [Planctomycetota bacterium]